VKKKNYNDGRQTPSDIAKESMGY